MKFGTGDSIELRNGGNLNSFLIYISYAIPTCNNTELEKAFEYFNFCMWRYQPTSLRLQAEPSHRPASYQGRGAESSEASVESSRRQESSELHNYETQTTCVRSVLMFPVAASVHSTSSEMQRHLSLNVI